MKKLIALLLVLLLPLCAFAELDEDDDCVVTLPGVTFFFTPPEEAYLLTRESSASAYNALGLSQREIVAWMEDYEIHALLFDAGFTCEVQVLAYEGWTDADFDDLTDYGAEMECNALRYEYTDQGYDVISCEMYYAPEGHAYIRLEATYEYEGGMVDRMVEYCTIQGGYVVSVFLICYAPAITPEQTLLVESVVDSLWILPS